MMCFVAVMSLLLMSSCMGGSPREEPPTRVSTPGLAEGNSKPSIELNEETKVAADRKVGAAAKGKPLGGAAQADLAAPRLDGSTLPAFEIEVRLDAATIAELLRRNERVKVDFGLFDSFAARPEIFRSWVGTLGPSGGVLLVPPQSIAPGPKGQTIKGALVNVTSARESAKDNLLDCEIWEDTIGKLPKRVQIDCVLLAQRQ